MKRAATLLVLAPLLGACPEEPVLDCEAPARVYADADGDGFGDPGESWLTCEADGTGVDVAGDCDDRNSLVYPGADERCDGLDDDCDGVVDEDAVDAVAWFWDLDGDGHGGERSLLACVRPPGTAADSGDCNDLDRGTHPGADEVCDGRDQDCDGRVDEEAIDAAVWYADGDGDGFGAGPGRRSCEPPGGGHASADGDCDDAEPTTWPGAPDRSCDGVDSDCDGRVEKAVNVLGRGGYDTIQGGLDGARDGDTVVVCPGTYVESLTIGRSVTLESDTLDPADVIIRPPGPMRTVSATGTDLAFRGLTLRGGGSDALYDGGNLQAASTTLTLEHCRIEDGVVDYQGGGVSWFGESRTDLSTITVRDTVFEGNSAGSEGGGLVAASWGPYRSELEDVVFRDNLSGYSGGGAALSSLDRAATDSVEHELIRVSFLDNQAGYSGGGLDIGGWRTQVVTLEDCTFEGNFAEYEGGGAAVSGWSPTDLTVDGCTFEDNTAEYSGWALDVGSWSDDEVALLDSTFRGNYGVGEDGGRHGSAVNMGGWGGTLVDIEGCTIEDNMGGVDVGGRGDRYEGTVSASAFTDNTGTALRFGGPVELTGGSFLRNQAGLVVLESARLVRVDLGRGADDNVEYDVAYAGTEYRWDGVTDVGCSGGACR